MDMLRSLFAPGKAGLLYSVDHAAFLAGLPARDVMHSADLMAQTIISSQRVYGQDLVLIHSDSLVMVEALGGVVEYRDNGPPVLVRRPRMPDLHPLDPSCHGRIPLIIDAALEVDRRLRESGCVVTVSVTGPFSLSAALLGEVEFLTRLGRDREVEYELLGLAAESSLCFIRAVEEAGLSVMVAEPLVSLISPVLFEELVAPSLSKLVTGRDALIHICGRADHLLPVLAQTGGIYFSLDRVDIETAVSVLSPSHRLMGGISPSLLRTGPIDRIRDSTRDLRRGFSSAQLMICSGCDLAWDCPPSHGRAMVEIATV